jgi:hypothetical protein
MDLSQYKQLEFRRKFWRIFGAEINIVDPVSGQMVGFIEMKAWKLREDIRIYTDRSKTQEILSIRARNIIDFGATYDVYDSATGQALFYLRRKGLKSAFVRDHWDIFTSQDQPYGSVQETSGGLALLRRYIGVIFGDLGELVFAFVAQTYQIKDTTGNVAAELTHRKNPLVVKFGYDTTNQTASLDWRVDMATVALLSIIDAAKNN